MRLDESSGASAGASAGAGASADADAMLSDSDVCSFGNVGRGASLPSPPHGSGVCLQQVLDGIFKRLGLRLFIFMFSKR